MRAKLVRVSTLVALAAAMATPPILADDAAPAAISNIRQENGARATRLVVEATAPLAYTYYSPDPLTLVVDIPEVDASKLPGRISVGTPEVESLQVTTLARADGRHLSRLEVKLANVVPYQIYSKDQSLNLVFERAAAAAAAPAPEPVAEPAAPAAAEAKAAEAPPAAPQSEPAEAPAAGPSRPATRVLSVGAAGASGKPEVVVKADGRLRYQDFFLGNPDRLVVDLKDVVSSAPAKSVDVNSQPVRRVRIGQFSTAAPRVARLVVDLDGRSAYSIIEAADGLRIVFGEGKAASAPLASIKKPVAPAPAPDAGEVPIVISPGQRPSNAALIIGPAAPAQLAPASAPEGLQAAGSDRKFDSAKRYTGHPINLDFKDGDLQDIFRLFADISGLNVVVNPGVSGKITLKLTEVPWDQALDLILKTNGLGYTLDDNVIRIAKLGDLQKEENEKQKLAEAKELAGDLQSWRKPLSYAKADELKPLLEKVTVSTRGTINVDKRTNTLIITDLPERIEKAKDLIAELDRSTPQVEIEARIVATSRNFTRDVGIQWGFLNRQTPDFGTTTNRQFPNSIILNGQGVPSTGGLNASGVPVGLNTNEGIGVLNRGYAVNLPAAAFNSALGVSMGNIIGSFNLDAAITALERQGRGRILSSPKVTTQNNQEAEIKQGIQIPIQTVANNTVTVTFKDAVLTLKVTPQITSAGTVLLKVEVENNTPDFANRVNGIPPINTQSAKTNVLVSDGATTVIGGIYQNSETVSVNSTPVLGQIPLLGYLFRQKGRSTSNNELLLFITPRITKG
jgi:type IV pilus assembly protein PilQ